MGCGLRLTRSRSDRFVFFAQLSTFFLFHFSLLCGSFLSPFLVLFLPLPLYQPLFFTSTKSCNMKIPTTIDPWDSQKTKLESRFRRCTTLLMHLKFTSRVCVIVSCLFCAMKCSFRRWVCERPKVFEFSLLFCLFVFLFCKYSGSVV